MSNHSPEVPTSQRLLKATAIAIAVASVVLVTAVLPAEYGIDPTGIGASLGLTALAQSPASAPEEPSPPAVAPAASPTTVELDAVGQPLKAVEGASVSKREGAYRSESMTVTLPPGEGAEIKTPMKSGDGMVFNWTATGAVASDMHGERTGAAKDEYTSYWIETPRRQASGTFTAPFDGVHGWYWVNKTSEPVTVQVEVTGFQQALFRP